MPNALARPVWRGRTNVDALTIAALEYAEALAGHEFIVTQGSYQSSVAASAGTHDKGGVVDLRWTGDNADITALRAAGFAAWHRTPAQGPWPDHVHAVLIGHPLLAPSAARQVESMRAGRNGLLNNGPDDGPRVTPHPRTNWWPPREEDDMPGYTEWPQEDRDALVADIVKGLTSAPIDLGDGKRRSLKQVLKELWLKRNT
jgi:hypothetical protein